MDLGGGPTWDARGALVALGYPYDFDELVMVDLPPDDRHPLYHSERFGTSETDRGQVRYEYRSMADLSFAEDDTVDLVYSGQSIEHVTEADGDIVLKESFRILRPGGTWPSTPPTAGCAGSSRRVHRPRPQGGVHPRGAAGQGDAGRVRGADRAGPQLGRSGGGAERFDQAALAGNRGIYYDADGCYLLALVIQKPALTVRETGPAGRSAGGSSTKTGICRSVFAW